MTALPAGSVIGILGGGQLGRMLATAAAQLGYRCHIYSPEADSVAADVAAHLTHAAWDDESRLAALAAACDVITYEFENVPLDTVRLLNQHCPVRPGIKALEIGQDRVREKRWVQDQGGATARFMPVTSAADLAAARDALGGRLIVKTVRFGYDGKGQVRVGPDDDVAAAWDDLGGHAAIAEALVEFDAEFSVIAVRGAAGDTAVYDSPHNEHHGGILARSSLPPPPIVLAQQAEARALAARIAAALDYVGVLTCEFFATADGPLFNEFAPRVHNSGHWTIEGAVTSQFENHIRAVAGLPLGSTQTRALPVRMDNLIGDAVLDAPALFADPDCRVHLYRKGAPRAGRKMGHATWVGAGAAQGPAA